MRQFLDIPLPPNSAGKTSATSQARDASPQRQPALVHFSAGESSTIDKLPTINANIATLADLNLPIDKKVFAKVIGVLNDSRLSFNKDISLPSTSKPPAAILQPANDKAPNAQAQRTNDLANLQSTQQSQQANIAPKQTTADTHNKQWLIQVGQNYILTETTAPLHSGQTIQVATPDKATLKLITLYSGESIPDVALKEALSNEQVQAAIRATLAKLLPQQTSLRSGFEILQSIQAGALTGITSTLQAEQKAQVEIALQLSRDNVPASEQILKFLAQPPSAKDSSLPSLIEQWLKTSGVNFEASPSHEKPLSVGLSTKQRSILNAALTLATTPNGAITGNDNLNPTAHSRDAAPSDIPSKNPLSTELLNATTSALRLSGFSYKLASLTPLSDSLANIDNALNRVGKESIHTFKAQVRTTDKAVYALHESIDALLNIFDKSSAPNVQRITTNEQIKQVLTNLESHNNKATIEVGKLIALSQTAQQQAKPTTDTSSKINTQSIIHGLAKAATLPSPQQLMAVATKLIPGIKQSNFDFKGLLQGIASHLATIEASQNKAQPNTASSTLLLNSGQHTSASTPATEVRGLAEHALLQKPFDFPRFDSAVLKAQAIMADQELTTGQLLKLVASMINRIQFNQANSLYQTQTSADPSLVQSWNMELPYSHQQQMQTLQLRIDQHDRQQDRPKKKDSEKAHAWTIQLSFNLDGIGPMHIQAEYTPPTLRSEIWVENTAAQQRVRSEQSVLIGRLKQSGIEAEEPNCRIGKPPQIKPAEVRHGLVDIRA